MICLHLNNIQVQMSFLISTLKALEHLFLFVVRFIGEHHNKKNPRFDLQIHRHLKWLVKYDDCIAQDVWCDGGHSFRFNFWHERCHGEHEYSLKMWRWGWSISLCSSWHMTWQKILFFLRSFNFSHDYHVALKYRWLNLLLS